MFLNPTVLWEDDHLISIDKPSGWLVHPLEEGLSPVKVREPTCLEWVRDTCRQRVYPLHRLDRPTSGVLLFGKSAEAARRLSLQLENGEWEKSYLALARGWMETDVQLEHPIWNESGSRRLDAVTHFCAVERFESPWPSARFPSTRHSLVAAFPRTGRFHQIRQHLKHLSHPVAGDTAHGDGRYNRALRERCGLHRLFLHARELRWVHPFTASEVRCVAPLPSELEHVLSQLRGAGGTGV